MDEPSRSTTEEIFGASEVTRTVTAINAHEFFQEHGLFYQEDAAIGGIVNALDQQGLSNSPDSFRFFSGCLLGDARIQSILQPYLSQPNSQFCRTFSSDPGHIFAFSLGPTHRDRVIVHMWGAGSQMEFYEDAHKKLLKGVLAANGLFEVPQASTRKNGCRAIKVHIEKGGIAITHYRHPFQIERGLTIAYGLERTPDQCPETKDT
ncbi:hypothetical protein LX32DRAFT_603550 [Colletotrichum zoysiae]|uniref:Uncharacterized protein n=1 Tax=Colletotrichum zoysiae TaxID=1216348 RepID=A0AAD9H5V7_9PEZI|nr:hypothetical protein LX32DRAFT_603550 [Colletotrichum zoysiae]